MKNAQIIAIANQKGGRPFYDAEVDTNGVSSICLLYIFCNFCF